ncbi:MAG: hypothetical protein FRX49_05792 [Trebouxia sp. A1-2]|nr:MAG: hypothetical protein FRX49_05792 [Trebouxia sp. A1-2]
MASILRLSNPSLAAFQMLSQLLCERQVLLFGHQINCLLQTVTSSLQCRACKANLKDFDRKQRRDKMGTQKGKMYRQLLLCFQYLGTLLTQLGVVAAEGNAPALLGITHMQRGNLPGAIWLRENLDNSTPCMFELIQESLVLAVVVQQHAGSSASNEEVGTQGHACHIAGGPWEGHLEGPLSQTFAHREGTLELAE